MPDRMRKRLADGNYDGSSYLREHDNQVEEQPNRSGLSAGYFDSLPHVVCQASATAFNAGL